MSEMNIAGNREYLLCMSMWQYEEKIRNAGRTAILRGSEKRVTKSTTVSLFSRLPLVDKMQCLARSFCG